MEKDKDILYIKITLRIKNDPPISFPDLYILTHYT